MNKNEKGFSLVELLVVVIIIAIVAAIAIPNLLASRRAANEASAISSLRTIHSAEATYFSTGGNNSLYGTIATLGTAGLIDATLAAGAKSGYTFTSGIGAANSGAYCANAGPSSSSTGTNFFGVDASGVIYKSTATPPVAVPCSATGILTTTGTAPIQ